METAAGLAVSRKSIDALKVTPLWLLTSVALSALLVWLVPSFQAALPEGFKAWLPLGVTLLGVMVLCKAASDLVHVLLARKRLTAKRERAKLLHLYRPLLSLFLTRHVTVSTGYGSPYLRQRIENAWVELSAYRRGKVGIKRAFHALLDQNISCSAEVEYGGDFPLTEILKFTRLHQQFADVRLLNLICAAERSKYEEPGNASVLTDAEFALYDYIGREHDRLSRRF